MFFKAWFSNLVWNGVCFAMGTISPVEAHVLVCCDHTCLVQDVACLFGVECIAPFNATSNGVNGKELGASLKKQN